jgi:hypothetical protein
MPSVVDWNDSNIWGATYKSIVGSVDYDAQWASFTVSGGVVQAPAHGLSENEYVIFRNLNQPELAELATYRAGSVTADTFVILRNATGFPPASVSDSLTGEFSRSRLGEVLTYGREYYDQWVQGGAEAYFADRWTNITNLLPAIQTTERILVGGAAFGWLCRAAHLAGFANCWGIDFSTWIQAQDPTNFAPGVTVVEGDLVGSGQVRNALRQATGDDELR